jgi:hypothetical protein
MSYTAEREKPERFHVFTDVTMKTQVCCHVEPCQMDRFTLSLRALRSSPVSVTIYQTTRRHDPEDLNIQRKTNLALLRAIYSIAAVDAHNSDPPFAFKRHRGHICPETAYSGRGSYGVHHHRNPQPRPVPNTGRYLKIKLRSLPSTSLPVRYPLTTP